MWPSMQPVRLCGWGRRRFPLSTAEPGMRCPPMIEEIEEAEHEKIRILYLVAPTRILTENGKVKGLECQRMELGEFDASGRRRPVPVKGSEFVLEVDMVIPAIGYMPDLILSSRRTTDLKSPKRERFPSTRSRWQLIFQVSLPEGMWSPGHPPSWKPWPVVTGQPSPSTGT